jgi:Xaa-Pro dipeptidase
MSTMPFSHAEYENRWAAVQAQMRSAGLESAVVWSRGGGGYDRFQEVYYLTNYYSCNSGYGYDGFQKGTRAAAHCAVILRLGQEPILIADDPTLNRALFATSRIEAGTDVVALLAEALHREGMRGEVGFVGLDCISAKHMADLRALTPEIQWSEHDDLVLNVRIIKSSAELDVFRDAGATVSNAMNALFKVIFSGGSEAEAAGEAAREVYRRQGNINFIHVGHGPWMAERITDCPIAGYSNRTPAEGELVRAWVYGAMHDGYWLDPGRTSVAGLKPSLDQRRLVESCADIVEKLRLMIRPGVHAAAVGDAGQRLLDEFNGGQPYDNSWYVFGHGNGLYFEPPAITPGYDGKHSVCLENMVLSTEAFLNLPGVGNAGFEQNFIVTKTGTELLTTTPMIWW